MKNTRIPGGSGAGTAGPPGIPWNRSHGSTRHGHEERIVTINPNQLKSEVLISPRAGFARLGSCATVLCVLAWSSPVATTVLFGLWALFLLLWFWRGRPPPATRRDLPPLPPSARGVLSAGRWVIAQWRAGDRSGSITLESLAGWACAQGSERDRAATCPRRPNYPLRVLHVLTGMHKRLRIPHILLQRLRHR